MLQLRDGIVLLQAELTKMAGAAGAWQAEAATWPALMLCARGGLEAMAEALAGLEVNPKNMTRNLALLPEVKLPPGMAVLIARALQEHRNLEQDWSRHD